MKNSCITLIALLVICPPALGLGQDIEYVQSAVSHGDWKQMRFETRFGGANTATVVNENYEYMSVRCFDAGNWGVHLLVQAFYGYRESDDYLYRSVSYSFDQETGLIDSRWIEDDASPFAGTKLHLFQHIDREPGRTEAERNAEYRFFVSKAKQSSVVRFRIHDTNGPSHEASFSLRGFAQAYAAACGG